MNLTLDERAKIFDKVCRLVETKHFNPSMNGVDWTALARSRRDQILGCTEAEAFEKEVHRLVAELKTSICHDLEENGSLRLTFHFSLRDDQISSLIHALQEELRSSCVTGEFYVRQLASTLIRYIGSRYSNQSVALAALSPGGLPPKRLRFVLDHIHGHLRTRLLSKDLARLVQMSPQHFANLFRKSTGRAPHEYVVHERIQQAKRLLAESSMPLVDIGFEVGFANQSHFGDSFRQATGTTPKKYRQCFELLPANPIRPIKIGRFDQAAASFGFGSKNIGFAG